MRASHQIKDYVARIVWQTDFFDDLTTEHVSKKSSPRGVACDVQVAHCQITFRKLGLKDVD